MNNEKKFLKNKQHVFKDFHFKNGAVLEDVVLDYGCVGTPKYDEEGNLVNAIIFCHGFEGNYTAISDFHQLIGEDAILDYDNYFFISITELGSPHSCSPSITGLKYDFPKYEVEDLVNFERKFIKEVFPEIKRLKGIIGFSIGGYIALGWSVFYPDEMDFIIHFASSFKTSGYKYIYAKLTTDIIELSPHFYSDIYDESISKVLVSLSQIQYLISFSNNYLNSVDIDEIKVMMSNFEEKGLFFDIYDIKLRNDFLKTYNLENELDKIKCKLLIIGVENNNYFIPEFDSKPLHDLVDNSKYILLDVDDQPNELEYIYKLEDDIKEFLDGV